MKMQTVCAIVLCLSLAGCSNWKSAEGTYASQEANYAVIFPAGWKVALAEDTAGVFTRDGLALQEIRIDRLSITRQLPNTKKTITPSMLPQEVAEVVVDDISMDFSKGNKRVTENVPDSIGGRPGFRIAFEYRTESGLKKLSIVRGMVAGKSLYLVRYDAPARHYYAKDLPVYEAVCRSFRLLNKTGV